MVKKWMGEVCLYLISVSYLLALTSITGNPVEEKISILCDSLLLNPEIEALTVGVIVNEHVYKFHKGTLIHGERPSDESLYEIASLTKTFTGTLLAQAIAEKKISLEDEVRDFFPGDYANLSYEGHPISIKHVLTHESGLPRMLPEMKELFVDPDFDTLPYKIRELQQDYNKAQFYQDLKKVRLDTIPGHKFRYSNAGANVMGYLLEEVYQTPFAKLMQTHIFQPLGMDHTKVHWTQADKAVLVDGQSDKKIKMPFMPEKYMSAEGGIVSNVDDMIRYMNFHLKSDNPIVAVSHQELWDRKYGNYEAGFFWQIIKGEETPDQLYQNGGAFGTSSWITLIPEEKIGIFLVTNTSGPGIHQKLKETVDSLLEVLK